MLQAIASTMSVALENARLYEDLKALLHQVGHALSSTLDYNGVIHSGLRRINDLFPAATVWFLEGGPGTGEQRLVASLANQSVVEIHMRQEPGDGFTSRLLEDGEPLLRPTALAGIPFLATIDERFGIQTRAVLAVPLTTTDRVTGAVGVSGSEPDAFDRGDLNMLQAIASTMSVALENARLYEDLKALLREREDTEARLIQSEKMAALGRLVATITHEVNNPLQAIQGCLSLAEEEMDGRRREEKLRRYLQVASTEIGNIADIIRRARAFYRPDAGGPRPTDVHVVLDSVLSLSGRQLQRSNVVVEREWAVDLPPILASPGQLRQVFLNLVLNAVDAMPGGGTLRVRTSAHPAPVGSPEGRLTHIRVDVSDTGEGMPQDVQDRLFEPFLTTKEDGTGLGLFISYGVIRAHRGEITATSRPGEGTTFTILLPAEPATEAAGTPQPPAA